MNLVSGYGSSDDDEPQAKHESTGLPEASASSLVSSEQQTRSQSSAGGRNRAEAKVKSPDTIVSNAGKIKRRKLKGSDSKGKTKKTRGPNAKKVNALILSPEIQAALARSFALGESDSDDETGADKKSSRVARPHDDPNDLLSLLPQPKAAAMAEDVLLKSLRKREAKAKEATDKAEGDAANTNSKTIPRGVEKVVAIGKKAGETSESTGQQSRAEKSPSIVVKEGEDEDPSEDDDSDGEDLLANMHAHRTKRGGETTGLFTLPSRSKPKVELLMPSPGTLSSIPAASSSAEGTMLASGTSSAVDCESEPWREKKQPHEYYSAAGDYVGQQIIAGGDTVVPGGPLHGQWNGLEPGTQGDQYWRDDEGGLFAARATREGGNTGSQAAGYKQGANQLDQAGSSSASALARRGTGEGESGAGGGSKASRRRGRDMERALASGDLDALGDETPVLDLHQGSNEYTPARSKPITAAMQQDKKHIEGSVYDPRTGQTVKTLEPTSLQRRKHQINQLAVQAANMERDLMERGSASRLTKAQTQAKYGW